MKIVFILLLLISLSSNLSGQANNGTIKGRVIDSKTNQGVPFASIAIWETTTGVFADEDGNFTFSGLKPGFIVLRASCTGFKPYVSEGIMVTNSKTVNTDILLEESELNIGEVVIKASPFRKTAESPVSARIIGIDEIERNPGGNRDISKVIESFPGVASTPAFRNDVIVRGGGPNENRFYLDNIEIPYLNHFSTQGSSGGPVGIINVDFVRSVDFISGAFPASRGNALSSVLSFSLIDGNKEKMKYKATLGASDLGLTLDGPTGKNSSIIISVRRSYLQFLFSALKLPFLPTYTDFQFKYKWRINDKNELTVLGLGAKDDFKLNLKADQTEYQKYILDYIPVQTQYSYVFGAVLKHFTEEGYDTWVLSRNYLNNTQYKYKNNVEVDSNKVLNYLSGEGEIKARYEKTILGDNGFRINFGAGLEYAHYTNSTYNKIFTSNATEVINYNTNLKFGKYGIFGQISQSLLDEKLTLSFGIRTDANNYSSSMANPVSQISPRFSASYAITGKLNLNMNLGRYYELPPYTALGYADNSGVLVNKSNNLKYIRADHLVAGIEYIPIENIQISVEGFQKHYTDYPFSVRDSVPISSKGADYGIFGNEELKSFSEGQAYGVEFLGRIKEFMGLNLVFAYTFVRSEFRNYYGVYIPTAWDNRQLFSLTGTKKLNKNWDAGLKFRYVGGAPYTPYDIEKSSLKEAWDLQGQGYLDYAKFNSLRLEGFSQLDIRVDKRYFFKNWALMLYVDIQNVLNSKADQPPILIRETDSNGIPLTNPSDPSRYVLKYISGTSGTVLPTVGIIVEF
jgi:CarboxypepD_reg-like domain/TonB-dependent Receptor Plug Domain